MQFLQGGPLPPHDAASIRPFSPPFLQIDGHLISHVANILLYCRHRMLTRGNLLGLLLTSVPSLKSVGDKFPGRLGAKNPFDRYMVNALQLSIADLITEAHDTHHPIDVWKYYDEQKEEAAARSKPFREGRIPKYLNYFSSVLGDKDWLVGDSCTYADLSTVQTLRGLQYAFPKSTQKALEAHPNLVKLMERVVNRPNLKAYLASPRAQAFSEMGIYRRYPELDP